MQKRRRPRDARGTPGRTSDPLAVHIVPRLPCKKRRRRRDARGTPGRTSDPLAVHIVPRLPCKRGGDQGTPEGHRGVHPTPWQCTLFHACHAKVSEWVSACVSEWVSKWESESVRVWECESVRVWEWECESVRVSEDRRTGGGRKAERIQH